MHRPSNILIVIHEPTNFQCGEIRRYWQTALLLPRENASLRTISDPIHLQAVRIFVVLFQKKIDRFLRAPVQPYDSIVQYFARISVPENGGFSLIGHADD